MLTNGARYYVDHAHPEYSTPECTDPLQVVLSDKAGERILARSMDAARRLLPAGQEIVVYKNNTDGKGNSYGCHENYLVDRDGAVRGARAQPAPVVRDAARCSPARARSAPRTAPTPVDYQISQRADFFEEEVGLETTLKRPIVNTRDEPHADPQKYRRLHVIVGDANLCEVATFLKVGTTAIVLAMIEDGFIDKDLSIIGPVAAMRTVSHDPTCRATVERRSTAAACTAVELQWEFLRLARKYADETGLEACGGDEIGGAGARPLGSSRCTALERDPFELDGQLDWVTKLEPAARRTSTATASSWDDPKLVAARPPVPRRPARPLAVRAAGAGGQGRAPGRRGRRARGDGRSARRPPGPTSGARASPAGPTRSSPRTGTASSSTSASTHCEGSR